MKRLLILGGICIAFTGAYGQTYLMGNTANVSTCSGTFYDSGGMNGSYTNNEHFTVTFCSNSGQDLYFVFSQFRLEASFDSLYIFNGSSTAAPLIGAYSGTNSPGTVVSNNASDCLTFYFKSDGSVTYLGWEAAIGCGTPPPPPPPAAGTACSISQPFCSGTSYNFPAATNTTAETGPDYGCVLTQPNPVWYYMQIDSPGQLDLTLSNTAGVDVDFVCWGPFASSSACGSLTATNIVDCSYSTAATENINISGALAGQFYILCITNFSNQPTNFTISSDGTSTANTNCNILCNITAMTAVPGPCDTATNMYTVSGSISLQYPTNPNDTLTITNSYGDSLVMYTPLPNPIPYTFPAHLSNGAGVTVNAQFALDTSCHFTTSYVAPQSCICSVTASNSSPACSGDSVNLLIAANGNITTYQWTGPNGYSSNQAQPTLLNTTAADTGLYTITITAGTCTATDTTRVHLFVSPVLGSPTITNSTCTAGGSISVTANGGTGAITYTWSNNVSGSTNSNLAAGPYSVTATDQNGCSTSATYTVGAAPDAITFGTPVITDLTCNGANNGSIVASASGGTGALGYVWSINPPAVTAAINGLSGGSYSVTAADQNGCSASITYIVNEPTAIVFNAPVIVDYSCTAGGSITANATGGTGTIVYSWSNMQSGATIANLNPGSYSVTATDANACSISTTYTVGSAANVVVLNAPTITQVSCSGGANGSITANPSGGNGSYTFMWAGYPSTATISSLRAGQYSVTVSDGTGCSASAAYTITEPAALVIDSTNITNVGCGGTPGSITAYVSGGTATYTYNWMRQSDSQMYSGQTITGLQADTYGLLVTDANSCTVTGSYVVTAAVPLAFTQAQNNVSCFGGNNGSATVTVTTGTPPYMYAWSGTATGNNPTRSNLMAGTINVTVTDANCSATGSFVITEPAQLNITQVSQTDVSCAGNTNGTIEVAASGGVGPYTYDWNTNPPQTGATASNLPAGPVSVVATDANACTATQTYVITEPAVLSVTFTALDATCFMAPNGSVTALASGGTPPYSYLWSDQNNQTTKTAFDLLAGNYFATITDSRGCAFTGSDSVGQPEDLIISPPVVTAVKCVGDKNGTITVNAQGGTTPYDFSATQDGANFAYANGNIITGLVIGTYTVIVADFNGCTKTVFATVPNATIDNFTTSTDSTSCYGDAYNDGSASIQPTPNSFGNGPFQYGIDGGVSQLSGDFNNLSAGQHIITATNANGCVTEVPVIVLEPLPIVVDVAPDTVVLPLGEGQQVIVTYINAPGEVTYSWTPELGLSCVDCAKPMVSPFTKQDYVVTISMVNGSATCYGSATLHADVSEPLPVYIPNSFTPNGDGNNDLFEIYGQSIKTVDLKIFNRWGEMVYATNNQFSGWDGTYKGQAQLPQVFTYAVKIVFLDDKKLDRKGTITLIR